MVGGLLELNKLIKAYPFDGVSSPKWLHLGNFENVRDGFSVVLNLYAGQGWNGLGNQNAMSTIFVKKSYNPEGNTQNAFGVFIEHHYIDNKPIFNQAKIIATSAKSCSIFISLLGTSNRGVYSIISASPECWVNKSISVDSVPEGIEQTIVNKTVSYI